MARATALILLFGATVFGQAAAGHDQFDQKKYQDAIAAYEKVPIADRDPVILNRLGLSYHLLSRFRLAENAYKAAAARDSRSGSVLNNLAALYYSQSKFSDAERQIRRAIVRNPESPVMRANLHSIEFARENTKAAHAVASLLAKTNPLLIDMYDNDTIQVTLLMDSKDVNEASLHERRGDSLFARKMYEEAIAEYSKSIAIDPFNASTLNRLGLVYHQTQNFNQADHYYQEAIKRNPYFIEVLNNIGTVEYGRRNYARALDQYKKALRIRPESATILLNMGACLFDMKRYDEALKATQRALEVDPHVLDRAATGFGTLIQTSHRNDPTVSFYFAKIYAVRGDKDLAISYLNRALDEGFTDYEKIKAEPAFASLSQQEGFIKIMDRISDLATSATPR